MQWSNYEYQPSFILGFHGCDKPVGENIISGKSQHLKPSQKSYDWLGHGIYFWEGNPQRAYKWACDRKAEGKIKDPFVLGAIIDLRRCLDLFDSAALHQVKVANAELIETLTLAGLPVPQNLGKTADKAARHLDCATINFLHNVLEERKQPAYDSLRAPFLEGGQLYDNSGFQIDNHLQICIRNPSCIKGYFRPIAESNFG
jgi:hypothetical protein